MNGRVRPCLGVTAETGLFLCPLCGSVRLSDGPGVETGIKTRPHDQALRGDVKGFTARSRGDSHHLPLGIGFFSVPPLLENPARLEKISLHRLPNF